MCFRCLSRWRGPRSILPILLSAMCCLAAERTLRVCADPNNLPFSNDRSEGFENRIAGLIARDLNATVEYTWWAQRQNFVRDALNAGKCDIVMGLPAGFPDVLETRPYYRSTYAFVYRKDSGWDINSLYDPLLEKLRIGVHIVGDGYAPPAQALARRGVVGNVTGYSLFGDASEHDPPARILEAVARGEIDIAIVWGPLAGYFAKKLSVPLTLVPIGPPFTYDIAVAVRNDEMNLKSEVQEVLDREQARIGKILDEYGVTRIKEGREWQPARELPSASALH